MRWEWEEVRNAINKNLHNVSFQTAKLVFDDANALSRQITFFGEKYWQTIGQVGPVVLLVIHTMPGPVYKRRRNQIGIIRAARKATAHERKMYEKENNAQTGFDAG